jgi:hypothetical protein
MKCPKCAAVCADTDPSCYACNASLGVWSVGGSERAGRVAMIFACIGACLAPMVMDAPKKPRDKINWHKAIYAGFGSVVGGGFGYLLGMLIPRRRE